MKQCTCCNQEFPATPEFFYRDNRRNGLVPICKTCSKKKLKAWLADNMTPERRKTRTETQRRSRAKHKDEINTRDRERNQRPKRKAQRKVNQREWYDNNRDYIREYHAEYRILKPHMRKAQSERRRASKRNAPGFHTAQDILEILVSQKGKCWWCGKKIDRKYHVDHRIALSRGGSNWPNNIVIACEHCNTSKGAKMPHEWIGRLL